MEYRYSSKPVYQAKRAEPKRVMSQDVEKMDEEQKLVIQREFVLRGNPYVDDAGKIVAEIGRRNMYAKMDFSTLVSLLTSANNAKGLVDALSLWCRGLDGDAVSSALREYMRR